MTTKLFIIIATILVSIPANLNACATCYGDPNSSAGKGMDMAIRGSNWIMVKLDLQYS